MDWSGSGVPIRSDSRAHVVLIDQPERRRRFAEVLAWTPLWPGWVSRRSNSSVPLAPSVIHKWLLTGVNKTKPFF